MRRATHGRAKRSQACSAHLHGRLVHVKRDDLVVVLVLEARRVEGFRLAQVRVRASRAGGRDAHGAQGSAWRQARVHKGTARERSVRARKALRRKATARGRVCQGNDSPRDAGWRWRCAASRSLAKAAREAWGAKASNVRVAWRGVAGAVLRAAAYRVRVDEEPPRVAAPHVKELLAEKVEWHHAQDLRRGK